MSDAGDAPERRPTADDAAGAGVPLACAACGAAVADDMRTACPQCGAALDEVWVAVTRPAPGAGTRAIAWIALSAILAMLVIGLLILTGG